VSDRLCIKPHPDPQVDMARPYIAAAAMACQTRGLQINRLWLDPRDPVDATIVLAESRALLWSEDQGWVLGDLVSGRPGERTVLNDTKALGGSVLIGPDRLAWLVTTGRVLPPFRPRQFANGANGHDGLYHQLAGY
jgi:Family of unknown function (DUF6292)